MASTQMGLWIYQQSQLYIWNESTNYQNVANNVCVMFRKVTLLTAQGQRFCNYPEDIKIQI